MSERDSDTYRAALAALARVRELHKPRTEPGWEDAPYCGLCAIVTDSDYRDLLVHTPWPCPTLQALDGGDR